MTATPGPSAYDRPRVSPGSLAEARVIVIGGSSGFGRQVVVDAAFAGAHVLVVGRDEAKTHAVAHEAGAVGGTANAFTLDATSPEGLDRLAEVAREVDHVVSTLGGERASGFTDVEPEQARAAEQERAESDRALVEALEPQVRDGGSFVFTSAASGSTRPTSTAGDTPLSSLVRDLALELAPRIRVNAVAPTWTPTPLWRDHDDEEVREMQRRMAEEIPLGRIGDVGEVAQAYLFLMTCGFVTGHTIPVDGGLSLR